MALTVTAPGTSGRWSALWGFGILSMFVGERLIGSGRPRLVFSVLGLLCVLAAIAIRFVRARAGAPDRRSLEKTLLGLSALGLAAVLLYFVQSDVWASLFDKPLEKNWPKLSTTLSALWPALWLLAAWPILLVELAHAQMARAPRLELGRIRSAVFSGFGIAAALIAALSFSYVASERNKKADLAYFRTTRPGEVSRSIVRNLDQPIEAAVFFPSGNEVREEVDTYLDDLGKESPQLKVTHYDFDIDPVKAKDYGVSSNGVIVFVRAGRKEQLGLPRDMEGAKSALRTLDKEVQQRLMMIVKPPRTAGFTLGHGERTWERPENDTDKRPGIALLRDALVDQTYDVRTVTAADGLGQEIPKNVTLLAVIGPRTPFLPEELATVNRFIDRGGRLLIALDPENKIDMKEVLAPLNLEFKAETLASEQAYMRDPAEQKISDRINIVAPTFTSHPSVSTMPRLGPRAVAVLMGSGWINTKRERTSDIPVDAPVKAHFSTFADKNGNFQQDQGEDKRAWEIAATAIKKDARVFVIADSDLFSDKGVRYAANGVLVMDVIHWLMGDEAFSGQVSTEADVKITHTRKQDVVWFYLTVFLVPALVICIGLAATRRKRRAKQSPDAAPATPPREGGAQ